MSSIGTQPHELPVSRLSFASAAVPDVRSRNTFETVATFAEQVCDVFTVTLACVASHHLYSALNIGRRIRYADSVVIPVAIGFGIVFAVLLAIDGGYTRANSLLQIRETERILRATFRSFVALFIVSFTVGHLISRATLLFAMVLVPGLLAIEKQCLYLLLQFLRSRGYGIRKVIVYGAGATGRRLFSAFHRSPRLGFKPVAIVDDDSAMVGSHLRAYSYRNGQSLEIITGPINETLISEYGAETVVVAIPSLGEERLTEITEAAIAAGANVAFVPKLSHRTDLVSNYLDIDGLLISSFHAPVYGTWYDAAKRLFDLGCSALILCLSAPLWLVLGVLIKLDSRGPVLFRQERIGKNGAPFHIFKFRTMHVDAPKYAVHPKDADDPRITNIGRWLRRTSLDELPQVLNVLKGEMSLVGPRPEMPFIVARYEDRHCQRLQVVPGITGLWQLSGDRAYQIHENIHYDLYYIRNRNFFMDMAIILHTFVFAMKGV